MSFSVFWNKKRLKKYSEIFGFEPTNPKNTGAAAVMTNRREIWNIYVDVIPFSTEAGTPLGIQLFSHLSYA